MTIGTRGKQERINNGVKQEESNDEDDIETLGAGASQGQIVRYQILCLFTNTRSGQGLQLAPFAHACTTCICTISVTAIALRRNGSTQSNRCSELSKKIASNR